MCWFIVVFGNIKLGRRQSPADPSNKRAGEKEDWNLAEAVHAQAKPLKYFPAGWPNIISTVWCSLPHPTQRSIHPNPFQPIHGATLDCYICLWHVNSTAKCRSRRTLAFQVCSFQVYCGATSICDGFCSLGKWANRKIRACLMLQKLLFCKAHCFSKCRLCHFIHFLIFINATFPSFSSSHLENFDTWSLFTGRSFPS